MSSKFAQNLDQFEAVEITFSEFQKTIILDSMPLPPSIIQYHYVMRLGPGRHEPCIHNLIQEFPEEVKFLKSNKGNRARYHYKSKIELNYLSKKIDKLQNYGYKVTEVTENYVEFQPSYDTSIAPIMSGLGLIPLYTIHKHNLESVFFAVPYKTKSYDLRAEFQRREDKLSKKDKKVLFPKKITRMQSDAYLPNIQFYNPKFMEFLIFHIPKFTKRQVMTLTALYFMAESGIMIHHVKPINLIEMINRHCKALSKRTLENHLQGNDPLQHKLAKIYDGSELCGSINSDSDYKPQFASDIASRETSIKNVMRKDKDKTQNG